MIIEYSLKGDNTHKTGIGKQSQSHRLFSIAAAISLDCVLFFFAGNFLDSNRSLSLDYTQPNDEQVGRWRRTDAFSKEVSPLFPSVVLYRCPRNFQGSGRHLSCSRLNFFVVVLKREENHNALKKKQTKKPCDSFYAVHLLSFVSTSFCFGDKEIDLFCLCFCLLSLG